VWRRVGCSPTPEPLAARRRVGALTDRPGWLRTRPRRNQTRYEPAMAVQLRGLACTGRHEVSRSKWKPPINNTTPNQRIIRSLRRFSSSIPKPNTNHFITGGDRTNHTTPNIRPTNGTKVSLRGSPSRTPNNLSTANKAAGMAIAYAICSLYRSVGAPFSLIPNSRMRSGPITSSTTVRPPKNALTFPARPHQITGMPQSDMPVRALP